MKEMKSFSGFIQEKAEYNAQHSKAEAEKHVRHGLMDELHKKSSQISEFSGMAAEHLSEDNYRSQTRPSLVNEINMKRTSINALARSASMKVQAIDAN